jgi:hypothetical protein
MNLLFIKCAMAMLRSNNFHSLHRIPFDVGPSLLLVSTHLPACQVWAGRGKIRVRTMRVIGKIVHSTHDGRDSKSTQALSDHVMTPDTLPIVASSKPLSSYINETWCSEAEGTVRDSTRPLQGLAEVSCCLKKLGRELTLRLYKRTPRYTPCTQP